MLGIERLNDIVKHYEELMNALQEPEVTADAARFQRLLKEQTELSPIVETYKRHERAVNDETDALEMLEHESDDEMVRLLKAELSEAKQKKEQYESELQVLLLPKDPNDEKNIFMEIRAGVGGDESALFAANLYRMYVNYAAHMGWRTEIQSFNENGLGGFKEVTFMVAGRGAYSKLKYESGVHRVQRVP